MEQGLVNKRHSAILRVQNLLALAQRARSDARLLPEFQARYEDLPTAVNAFESFHLDLLATVPSSEMDAQDEVQTNFDSLHYSIKSIYREIFGDPINIASDFDRSNHSLNSSQHRSSRDNIRLPRIEIPKFDGNIKGWPTFYDVYRTLIHENTGLTDIERFQYLVASLSKDALTVVKNLPITEDNYKIAYAALVARYQNKRVLLTNYWQSIVHSPTNKDESASMLRSLLSTFSENLIALEQFQEDMWDFTKFSLLLQKLDSNTRKRFELEVTGTEVPKYDTLYQFLLKQCHALEAAGMSSTGNSANQLPQTKGKKSDHGHGKSSTPTKSTVALVAQPEKTRTCVYCSQEHSIFNCNGFLQLDVTARHKYIKDNAFCFNCFAPSHGGNRCPSRGTCQKCDKRHHTLLHFSNRDDGAKHDSANTAAASSDVSVPAMTTNLSPGTILFQTALICIRDAHGNSHTCRALLDSASGASFITSTLIAKLGLAISQPIVKPIRGLAQMSMSAELSTVECTVTSRAPSVTPITLEMIVIPNICDHLPSSPVRVSDWTELRKLSLADPTFSQPGPVDVMLGADVYFKLLKEGIQRVNHGQLTAINTIFGWVITGAAKASHTRDIHSFSTFVFQALDATIKQMWELDQVPQSPNLSADDQRCAALYDETCVRESPNRYIVSLPFRNDRPALGDSYQVALRRFTSLENRLNKDPQLRVQYASFMRDYLDQGHMRLVSPTDLNWDDVCYIPHHCVFKNPGDPTTIRVVFDGSATSSNGVSLNSTLYTGPKLQRDIASVLLTFRLHKIVFTADIRQMYRQIQISDAHQRYQRILWRFSPRDPIQHYQLTTVTYGVSSSPYLAIRTLFQLCDDEGSRYPLAAQVLRHDTYVDDIVSGAESPDQALQLQQQLIALTGEGGFELRKWASSHPLLLSSIPADHQQPYTFDTSESAPLKILGLQWRPDSDTFSYQVDPIDRLCTKRTVLSDLARVYDPLGFLTPITLFAKHLMQCLWSRGLQWDEPPPPEIVAIWSQFTTQLPSLSALQLPRRAIVDSSLPVELHGFCDASENGYAAVIYLRQVEHNGKVHVGFLCAKSKVSPLNRVSIPRLELCGAVLLANLIEFVRCTYEGRLSLDQIYAWSDSTVALSWIQSSPHRWKTFVANRVSHIQDKIPPSCWNHVDGVDNPADCASRGVLPDALPAHPLWWAGPSWLHSSPKYWPQTSRVVELPLAADAEQRRIVFLTHDQDNSFVGRLLSKFSSLRKIMGIVAFCQRFITNCAKPARIIGPLSEVELYNAQTIIVRDMQRDVFSREIENLQNGLPCSKPLRKLAPFLDPHGVIRVGGRLRHSELDLDAKHPMLLPRAHRLTELIIRDIHTKNLHPGPRALHYLLSQRFWVLSPRRAINHTVSKCFRCARVNPKALTPMMSDLPPARVSQVKPFSHTGIDFAGPFTITMGKYRGAKTMKAYICVFICFATKAMHLELVSDLSSEACLAAMRRFVARRGRCSHIYSDCGTNFVGVNRTLSSFCKDAAETSAIAWHFNPPAAPHFGGLWEAGVKSVKTHLKRVVGLQCLTYEELLTVLSQIEAVLNSRPLCPMSDNPNDVSVLTPGHFLTLEPLTAPPDPDLTPLNVGRLNRWQLVQRLQQDFWRRWHIEYLHTLQQRGKWTTTSEPPTEGTLVLLKDENVPPLQWVMGRIIKLYPSRDGTPRVAQIRTKKGVLDRPLVKVCPLPRQ